MECTNDRLGRLGQLSAHDRTGSRDWSWNKWHTCNVSEDGGHNAEMVSYRKSAPWPSGGADVEEEQACFTIVSHG